MRSAKSPSLSRAPSMNEALHCYLSAGISNYLAQSFSSQKKQCRTERTTNLIQSIFSLLEVLAFLSKISVESRFKRSPLCEVSCITRNNEKSAIILPRWCDN